jgi:hypothetical protein
LRYCSLLYRQPYVFSPAYGSAVLHAFPAEDSVFQTVLRDSFEAWVPAPDGGLLPRDAVFGQERFGGCAAQCRRPENVKDGNASVELTRSTEGDSYLQYRVPVTDAMKGKHLNISLWVKSDVRRGSKAIAVEIQSAKRTNRLVYTTPGQWQKIEAVQYVPPWGADLSVFCTARDTATAPAYFDDLTVEVLDRFALGLRNRRWNSFLLTKGYFHLIHSGLPPLVLKEVFAVKQPLLQFRERAEIVGDEEFAERLAGLGEDKAIETLRTRVFVDRALPGAAASAPSSGLAPLQGRDPNDGTASREPGGGGLRYAVESYNVNSVEMKVIAPRRGLLYWVDGYDKDWRAYVNGAEVPIARANLNFKAIALPAGESRVRFTFEPADFKVALWAFYGLAVLASLGAAASWLLGKAMGRRAAIVSGAGR